jgi:hypothetical protein
VSRWFSTPLEQQEENQAAFLRTSSLGFVGFCRTGLTLIFSRRIPLKDAVVEIAGRIVFAESRYLS